MVPGWAEREAHAKNLRRQELLAEMGWAVDPPEPAARPTVPDRPAGPAGSLVAALRRLRRPGSPRPLPDAVR